MLLHKIKTVRQILVTVVGICILATAPCISYGSVSEDLLADAHEPKQTSVESTKDGLVEIQTGLMDENTFRQVRKSNGFLISNSEGEVHVVTTRRAIKITEKDREKADVDENAPRSIRIIVRGDVVSELSEEAVSKKQDFCILKSDDVVQSKGTVSLRDSGKGKEGETVHVLGFPSKNKNGDTILYESSDVKDIPGQTLMPIEMDGATYIRHTVSVPRSLDGSVLVDADGFVIGMNTITKSDGEEGHALAVTDIESVLNDFGIPYETDLSEQAYQRLYSRCQQGIKQSGQSRYKAESKMQLEGELQYSAEVLTEKPYDLEALLKADERLAKAQDELKTKIPKLVWVNIILGAVLLFILIRFLKLLIWRRKNGIRSKKKNPEKKNVPDVQSPDEDIIDRTIVPSGTWHPEQNQSEMHESTTVSLYWVRKGTQVPIDSIEFVIGKKRDAVDFAIEDNRLISRVHAAIQVSGKGCRIIDLKSSNGTYVNDLPVPESGLMLQSGDLVRLANEEFVFERT